MSCLTNRTDGEYYLTPDSPEYKGKLPFKYIKLMPFQLRSLQALIEYETVHKIQVDNRLFKSSTTLLSDKTGKKVTIAALIMALPIPKQIPQILNGKYIKYNYLTRQTVIVGSQDYFEEWQKILYFTPLKYVILRSQQDIIKLVDCLETKTVDIIFIKSDILIDCNSYQQINNILSGICFARVVYHTNCSRMAPILPSLSTIILVGDKQHSILYKRVKKTLLYKYFNVSNIVYEVTDRGVYFAKTIVKSKYNELYTSLQSYGIDYGSYDYIDSPDILLEKLVDKCGLIDDIVDSKIKHYVFEKLKYLTDNYIDEDRCHLPTLAPWKIVEEHDRRLVICDRTIPDIPFYDSNLMKNAKNIIMQAKEIPLLSENIVDMFIFFTMEKSYSIIPILNKLSRKKDIIVHNILFEYQIINK